MLSRKELAEKLNINVRSLDRLVKKGLPCLRVGGLVRFDYDKVLEWLESRQEGEK